MTAPTGQMLNDRANAKAIFRSVAGSWPSGVAVITARDGTGAPVGLTMSAVMSLSIEPIQWIISVDRKSNTLPAILDSRRFCINFMAKGQQDTAMRFASKTGGKFTDIPHQRLQTGGLVLTGSMAYADCEVAAVHEGGDHLIVVGSALDMALMGGEPLIWWAGGFHEMVA